MIGRRFRVKPTGGIFDGLAATCTDCRSWEDRNRVVQVELLLTFDTRPIECAYDGNWFSMRQVEAVEERGGVVA